MITLSHVCKNYKIGKEEVKVLKDINLTVERGEFIAVTGPSGCGKTSLLNLISGMDRVSQGEIQFYGQRLDNLKDKELAKWRRSHIGYIFQQFNLIEFMTAQRNVEIVLQLNGVEKSLRKKKSIELLEMVGLKGREKHRPSQLSGGQKQRVAIARALAGNPDILLADEPTGAMDSNSATEILALLKQINKERNVTVIMVTHDNVLAEQADRKICMLDGKIVQDTKLCKKDVCKKEEGEKWNKKAGCFFSTTIAFQNMLTKKKRVILTSLATSIGVMGVLLTMGIGFGVKNKLLKEVGSIVNENIIDVVATNNELDETTVAEILEKEEVLNIYPNERPEVMGLYHDVVCAGLVQVIGPVEQPVSYWQENLLYGSLPASNRCNEAVITETMAKKFVGEEGDVESIVGKEIDMVFVASSKDCIPKQVQKRIKVVGIAGKAFLGMTEMVSLPYLLAEDIVKESLQQENYTSGQYCVTVRDKEKLTEVKNELCEMGLNATIDEEALGAIGTVIDMVIAVIALIAGISLIIAGIMIALVTYIGVVERTREIGILKAIGFSSMDVKNIFLMEGATVGLFSGMIGAILANFNGKMINAVVGILYPENAFNLYHIEISHTIFCVVFGILIGLLCSLSSAGKAAKMEPVKALGYVE